MGQKNGGYNPKPAAPHSPAVRDTYPYNDHRSCLACGGSVPFRRGWRRYCSARCRWNYSGHRPPLPPKNYRRVQGECLACGRDLGQQRLGAAGRLFCNATCARWAHLGRIADCAQCGGAFATTDSRRIYCSADCGQTARRGRASRVWGHGKTDKFTRQKVLDRDDWTCYLCQRPIPRDLAWPAPLSASVDHVVPVQAGGSDRPDNLRATHWHCNLEKGDALPGTEIWVLAEVLA